MCGFIFKWSSVRHLRVKVRNIQEASAMLSLTERLLPQMSFQWSVALAH